MSQAPPPISHSDHCRLSFNSNHLHLINTQLSQHYLSTHLTSVSYLISLTRSGLTSTLHSYLPQDCLLPIPRWSSVFPTSACLRPSPQLIFGVGPRCVLNHVVHEFPSKKTIISISFIIICTSRYLLHHSSLLTRLLNSNKHRCVIRYPLCWVYFP